MTIFIHRTKTKPMLYNNKERKNKKQKTVWTLNYAITPRNAFLFKEKKTLETKGLRTISDELFPQTTTFDLAEQLSFSIFLLTCHVLFSLFLLYLERCKLCPKTTTTTTICCIHLYRTNLKKKKWKTNTIINYNDQTKEEKEKLNGSQIQPFISQ